MTQISVESKAESDVGDLMLKNLWFMREKRVEFWVIYRDVYTNTIAHIHKG